MRRSRALLALCLWWVAWLGSDARAHDLGYTDVWVSRTAESVTFDVHLDLEHVPDEAPPPLDTSAETRQASARAIRDAFAAAVTVREAGAERPIASSLPVFDPSLPLTREDVLLVRIEAPIDDAREPVTFAATEPWGRFLLMVQDARGESVRLWAEPGAASEAIPGEGSAAGGVVPRYLKLGFLHILPRGLDHILFVLGLFLAAREIRPLIVQVTTFTVAHSVTLALSTLGLVALPGSIVEALIAASIVWIGVENLAFSEPGRGRVAVVFGFGLLHGLGFAGVLGELGLPEGRFVPALIAFNVGVELGQLAVLGLAFAAVGWLRDRPWYFERVALPGSLVILVVGMYWLVERAMFGG